MAELFNLQLDKSSSISWGLYLMKCLKHSMILRFSGLSATS